MGKLPHLACNCSAAFRPCRANMTPLLSQRNVHSPSTTPSYQANPLIVALTETSPVFQIRTLLTYVDSDLRSQVLWTRPIVWTIVLRGVRGRVEISRLLDWFRAVSEWTLRGVEEKGTSRGGVLVQDDAIGVQVVAAVAAPSWACCGILHQSSPSMILQSIPDLTSNTNGSLLVAHTKGYCTALFWRWWCMMWLGISNTKMLP